MLFSALDIIGHHPPHHDSQTDLDFDFDQALALALRHVDRANLLDPLYSGHPRADWLPRGMASLSPEIDPAKKLKIRTS